MFSKAAHALVLLLSLSLLSGCFGPTGKVRVKTDVDNAQLFINGELTASIGKDFVELELPAATHSLEIKALSDDEEWRYYGQAEVIVAKNAIVEKSISTSSKETEKRKARIALEAKQREAKRLARKVQAEFERRQSAQGASQ